VATDPGFVGLCCNAMAALGLLSSFPAFLFACLPVVITPGN